MTIRVEDGERIYVFGAIKDDGMPYSDKYVRAIVQKKLKAMRIFGVELWDLYHKDRGSHLFEVVDRFGQFTLEDGEIL